MRTVLIVFFAVLLSMSISGQESERPNVLLIMLDDLNDFTGFLGGHPQVKTPHMDALAAEGISFINAHTNAPICAPSRASMLTGIYPHVSGNYWFDNWTSNTVLKNSKSLARYLRDNGYLSYGTGKLMHHKQLSDWTEYGHKDYFGPYPFNGVERCGHPSVPEPYRHIGINDGVYASLADVPNVPADSVSPGYNGWYDNRTQSRFRYVNGDDRDKLPDEVNADWASLKIRALDELNESRPFFLGVGFVRPHTPLVAPQKYFDMYPLDSLLLPTVLKNDKADCHYRSTFNGNFPPWSTHYYTLGESYDSIEAGLRAYLQAYLACVSFVDAQVGKVVDALRNSSFNDNTIVILTSDHGYAHGEKEWLYKNSLWEESTRVPMLVRVPGNEANAGRQCINPVSLIDVYPTIADLCRITADNRDNETGARLSGHSMQPFIENPLLGEWTGPDVALTLVKTRNWGNDDPSEQNYSVRSKHYRYTLYDNGAEELYDHRNDPYEWVNLADSASHAGVKAGLRAELKSLVRGDGAYYLSQYGNDDNYGTKGSPWKTLEKISSVELQPGDSVLFNRGDLFSGHFVVNGSGTEDKPIVISAYGSGSKPVITGRVGNPGGGDYREAILVENNDNMVFEGLEVQNERIMTRDGVDSTVAYGMQILNSGTETMRNFIIRDMNFRNVYAVKPMLDPEDFNNLEVSGLRFFSQWNGTAGKEKHIRDILVENCFFNDIQRFGIHIKHGGAKTGIGNDSLNRNMNIVCRNNEFFYNGGTSILPQRTYNCLIENNIFDHPGANTDPRMPGRGSSVWTWRSMNTVIQYNQCLSARGYFDSHGIHVDHECVNTFIQYNYMYDCEGGFVEILGGNKNAVYRFNVSVNDGWRQHPTWKNSNHTIWINNKAAGDQIIPCDSSYIYNNTVYLDRNFTTAIEVNAKNTFIYNNIFSSVNGGVIGGQNVKFTNNGTPLLMRNNLFQGAVASAFVDLDTEKVSGDPKFTADGEDELYFRIDTGSPAIDAGLALAGPAIPGAGKGIFGNLPPFPTVDIYGNPVDLSTGTPNIGACNVKLYYDTISSGSKTSALIEKNTLTVYPNPAGSLLNLQFTSSGDEPVMVSMADLKGRVVLDRHKLSLVRSKRYTLTIDDRIPNGIYTININNGKENFSRRMILVR